MLSGIPIHILSSMTISKSVWDIFSSMGQSLSSYRRRSQHWIVGGCPSWFFLLKKVGILLVLLPSGLVSQDRSFCRNHTINLASFSSVGSQFWANVGSLSFGGYHVCWLVGKGYFPLDFLTGSADFLRGRNYSMVLQNVLQF